MNFNTHDMKYCGEQITDTVTSMRAGRIYGVGGKQFIQFIHMDEGVLQSGTTNEELLTVLIHRTMQLDEEVPCVENKIALMKMAEALNAFQSRSQRTQQRAPIEVAKIDPSQDPHCLGIG